MSDGRRFALICGVACGLPTCLPDTTSWLVFVTRPIVVVLALCALAPWRS